MNRLIKIMINTTKGMFMAISRFPLTVFCLGCATIFVCYMISLHKEPELIIQKLMFTSLFGAFLGVAAQFSCERLKQWQKKRIVVYLISALLILGYYFIILPAPSITFAVRTRTFVAVFAMFCTFIWMPSFRGKADFNSIALTHFKSAFTSILYSAVLAAGCSSIIAAIDILLFKVSQDAYSYLLAIIWIFFATLYYLSLLPHFNSESEDEQAYALHAARYPQSLKILISYIAVPLVTAYSLVLVAYFIKILITFKWPSGQLGPMILAYSAVGLIVFVLASRLEDKFAAAYRKVFPKVLILMIIMQLISVVIRLNTYGVTESRYYLTLFGVYSLVCGIVLSFKPVINNSMIALLGAGLAIFSVIPPVDAFTVSRNSQITRLEKMLSSEGVLLDGKIIPKTDVPLELRMESTSILNYLERRNYLKYMNWLPADFKTNDKMKSTFGFEPAYEAISGDSQYFNASLDMQKPFSITGYDIIINTGSFKEMKENENPTVDFQVRNTKYKLIVERISPQDIKVSVKNMDDIELVSTSLYEFAHSLSGVGNAPKESIPPESMTLDVENNGYRLRIVLQNINITYGTGGDAGVNYNFFALFAGQSE
ncbi:MAG: DUF4153 domain-containing protein [Desulfitobacteriaceae bacterium]